MADSIPQLAWTASPEGQVFWYNQRWYDYTGTTPDQMEGSGWQSVHDPDELPKVLERWKGSIASGEPFDMVVPLRGADGQFRSFLTRVMPHRSPEGRVLQWFGTNTDITERIHADKALRESEERFRQLANAMPQIVWTARPDGHLDYFNERWYEYTGLPRESDEDEGWMPILHPDDVQSTTDAWHAAVQSGQPYEIEYRFKNAATGEYRWHMGRAVPVRDDAGGIVRWFGTSTDIHDKKLAEEELRELNATLEDRVADSLQQRLDERQRAEEALFGTRTQLLDAIEILDAGFVMYGPDEKMVVCNSKYKEIYAECAHKMVPGTPYEEVLRAFVEAGAVSHTGLSEEEWIGQRLHAHRNPGQPGEQPLAGRWIRISDRLTSNGGVVSLRTDITALKHAQQAAEDRALDLARSERALRHQTDILTSILNSMGDAVIVADRDGKFLVFNPAAERMFGAGAQGRHRPTNGPTIHRLYLPDGKPPPYPTCRW